jgi:hypothetical protein
MQPAAMSLVLATVFLVGACGPSRATPAAPARAPAPAASVLTGPDSLDALYENAKAEGGPLSLYGTINPNTAAKVFAAFETRFPEIKIEWVDGISERLVARIISEARGSRNTA